MKRAATIVAMLVLGACELGGLEVEGEQAPVIGGDLTPAGLYPATGALLVDGQMSCTGTLIAPDVVLTAGHCVDSLLIGSSIPSFTLALDANSATGGEVIAGAGTRQHPDFDLTNDPVDGIGKWFDIGLVLLSEPITSVDYEILPSPQEAASGLVSGLDVEIVGYGLISNDTFEVGVKHHGVADLVEVGDWELAIAEPGQQQNCNGDSGGPAYVDIGGDRRLVGVVSRSPDEDPVCDHGGVDTRVDAYLDWIHANATIPCGSGLSEPCPEPDAGPGGGDGGPGADDGGEGGCCAVGGGSPSGSAALILAVGWLLGPHRRRRRR